MKRLVFIVLLSVFTFNAFAWNRLGHAVAVAVAQRHLTDEAKKNIARYIDYDLKEDASWMDMHRKDVQIQRSPVIMTGDNCLCKFVNCQS